MSAASARSCPTVSIPLDDLFAAAADPPGDRARAALPPDMARIWRITWDVAADGPVPVARSHAELIAGGLAVLLEGRLPQNAVILSTLALASFAGLAITVVPWLLVGGTLVLHHPFDRVTFAQQRRDLRRRGRCRDR